MSGILAICSTVDFPNFTRRATIEAISDQRQDVVVLLYNGLRAILQKKVRSDKLPTYVYHNWLPSRMEESNGLGRQARRLKKLVWGRFFGQFEYLLMSDPAQYVTLDYISDRTYLLYVLRDANVLQNEGNKCKEQQIIQRANLVLATSKNLAVKYLPKYYGSNHSNIEFWPNCVDLKIWNECGINRKKEVRPKIGVIGNFNSKRTDYHLLRYIAESLPHIDIEIAGKIDWDQNENFWASLLQRENVIYKGILPLESLPEMVAGWSVGLVTDGITEYGSYMHHNKVYQYLAMGIPVVSLKIHGDYDSLFPWVRTATSYVEYRNSIEDCIEAGGDPVFREGCIKTAKENSSERRAEYLLKKLDAERGYNAPEVKGSGLWQ